MTTDLHRLQQLATAGKIAAGTCHEVRNLVTAVIGFAQIATERPDDRGRHLQAIEHNAQRCVDLLDELLVVARAPRPCDRVDPGSVVTTVAAVAGRQAALRRVRIARTVADGLPDVGVGRGELTQVVLNLLLNAIDASEDGGAIAVEVSARDGRVDIAVSDGGTGVPVELRAQIFEPFFTTKRTGTGLGLAVCHQIVSGAGGSITVDDAPGGGARFVVSLAVAP